MRLTTGALAVGVVLCCMGLSPARANSPLTPNDQYYYPYEWYAPKLSMPQAWGVSTGSVSVTVAILDTGVDPNTPDLAGRVLPAMTENGTGAAYSGDGLWYHGSAVASVLAGGVNNGIGGAGVGNFKLLPITVTDYQGHNSSQWIANGIIDAANAGAKVINISQSANDYATIDAAAAYAKSKGALTFIAAGNGAGLNTGIPAGTYKNLVFVAGTDLDSNGNLIPWSGSSYGGYVNISAPANNMLNADNTQSGSVVTYGYALGSGTSFATPLAAGAAALAWSINPNLTPDQVQNMLLATSIPFTIPPGEQGYFGAGELNIGGVALAAEASLSVPEPASLGVLGAGALVLLRRRGRRATA